MTHPAEQPYSETTFDRDTPTPMEDDTEALFDLDNDCVRVYGGYDCDCDECRQERAV